MAKYQLLNSDDDSVLAEAESINGLEGSHRAYVNEVGRDNAHCTIYGTEDGCLIDVSWNYALYNFRNINDKTEEVAE